MRKTICLGIVFLILFSIALVSGANYVPPSYNSFSLVLPGSYTPQSYNNFTLVLNKQVNSNNSDTCTCPASPANYIVNASDSCVLNSLCNITGYNLTISGIGNYTINSTIQAENIFIGSGVIVWIKSIGIILLG